MWSKLQISSKYVTPNISMPSIEFRSLIELKRFPKSAFVCSFVHIYKRSLGQCTLGITSCPVPRNYTDYHFSILTGAETQSRYQKNAFFLCLIHRIRQFLKALFECNASKDGNFYFLSLYMSICFHVMMIYKSPLPNLGSRLGR